MPCKTVTTENGGIGFLCSHIGEMCGWCGSPATKLCDASIDVLDGNKIVTRTCDLPLCDNCAVQVARTFTESHRFARVAHDFDLCPHHASKHEEWCEVFQFRAADDAKKAAAEDRKAEKAARAARQEKRRRRAHLRVIEGRTARRRIP